MIQSISAACRPGSATWSLANASPTEPGRRGAAGNRYCPEKVGPGRRAAPLPPFHGAAEAAMIFS